MHTVGDSPDDRGGASSCATSRSLIARVQSDEPDAWSRLVRLYAPLVFQWCRSAGLQSSDAADVFQDVFQAVATNMRGFHRGRAGDTFRGWLRRITQNKIVDHYRRRDREAPGIGGSSFRDRLAQWPEPGESESASIATGERLLVTRALGSIRCEFEERTWLAFWRTAVDARDTRDVAADLRMTTGAVRVAKARVLRRLREELGDVS